MYLFAGNCQVNCEDASAELLSLTFIMFSSTYMKSENFEITVIIYNDFIHHYIAAVEVRWDIESNLSFFICSPFT